MKKVIICVDDEYIILEALKQQLSKKFSGEAQIELAQSGEEAIQLIGELLESEIEIPVVISDQTMPGMNGIDFLLQVHEIIPDTNKILITGKTENQQLVSLVNKVDLYRYISKPWEEADLQLTISEAFDAYNRERDLALKNQQLHVLNSSLEEKVNERTQELATKTDELKETVQTLQATQNQLLASEKLAALGQLMAGIAHEINTPLGAINASAGSLRESFWNCISSLRVIFQKLNENEQTLFFDMVAQGTNLETVLSTKEARQKRKDVTAILHEWGVNNPTAIADRMVDMNLMDDLQEFKSLLSGKFNEEVISAAFSLISQTKSSKNIILAVQKASKVVHALKSYSRFNEVEEKAEVDILQNIETVLVLYHNQIKQGIEIVKNFDETHVLIECYPDELIQVWTNLIHNSIHAMKNHGKIEISLRKNGQSVEVIIADNGPGIPKEIQSRVFDAFFTTKPTGEGTGLGLDIVRKIIEKHQGKISFESGDQGTSFHISLPK